jgi:hypothetical protein
MAMKIVVACMIVAMAVASQTEYIDLAGEIPAPPGEKNDGVVMIQEKSGETMGDDVVYRISWNTQYDSDPAKTASKGTFKIKITGTLAGSSADTGFHQLVTHPGYACGAASDPECFPDITGTVLAADDASANCKCNPNLADGSGADPNYDEAAAKWAPIPGKIQKGYVKAADVGEITKVEITGDGVETSNSWTPGFLKINMNDMETGVGNGIYYMDIGKKINKDKPLTLEAGATDAYGEQIKMDKLSSHKYGIIKCEAAACEEKMEKMMKMEALKK